MSTEAPPALDALAHGRFPDEELDDAATVAAEGRAIAATGVDYLVDGLIPSYGMVGLLVAYAKVGKTSLALELASALARGAPFLDRTVKQARPLVLACEDPPEYVAWLARHLDVPPGAMTVRRKPLQLSDENLWRIVRTVQGASGHDYGAVILSSWQAVVLGLVKDENDNSGNAAVMERVKTFARLSGVPWLIDAHSGKGEDQSDDADPIRALRGASSLAGSADFMLSLRYADGAFGTRRRLSGRGRFVVCEPMLIDYNRDAGTFALVADNPKACRVAADWARIEVSGILDDWASAEAIARAIGLVGTNQRSTSAGRKRIHDALRDRSDVDSKQDKIRGQKAILYRASEKNT